MFGNPGSSEESLLDALSAAEFGQFKYYLALHEGSVVAMADAYARASIPQKLSHDAHAWRRPAIVQLHSYAGLANGLGMMNYAKRGYTPLVVFAGESGLRYDALDGQMSGDLCAMARPFVKSDHNGPCAWRVVDTGSLLRLLRRAIKTASTPPMGPVFLSLPMDLLDQPAVEEVVPSSVILSRVLPQRTAVVEAARLLAEAKRPLILFGDGIAASEAQDELADLATLVGAVAWGANASEINLRGSHSLFGGFLGHMFGEQSGPITSRADVVLVCGTTVLPEVFPLLQGVFAREAKVIQFDLNPTEIGKNFPVAVGAIGDPKLTLEALCAHLRTTLNEAQRAAARERTERHCAEKVSRKNEAVAADRKLPRSAPLHAAPFMDLLCARLPPGAVIFDEALTHSPELLRYLPLEEYDSYYQTRAGMLGTGLPGAIGLKLARPDRTVLGVCGDGGSISTVQALATAARYRIGAKLIVCNNRSYRILKYNLQEYWAAHGQSRQQRFPESFELGRPGLRFDELAHAQGVRATRVESFGQIEPALAQALGDDEPFLIDLVLSDEL